MILFEWFVSWWKYLVMGVECDEEFDELFVGGKI